MAKVLCLIAPRSNGTVVFRGKKVHEFAADALGNLVADVEDPDELARMLKIPAHFRRLTTDADAKQAAEERAAKEEAEKEAAEAKAKADAEAAAKAAEAKAAGNGKGKK